MSDSANRDDDDELGLDESLSSMRSMFREMRDEEPSDRGMAALMAAAREQAEVMKPKRSWWAVLLEQLRRPPVLAMATVVVLIGGAVVISQRHDRGEMQTESEMAESTPTETLDKAASAPMPAAGEKQRDRLEGGGGQQGGEAPQDVGGVAAGSVAPVIPEKPAITQSPRPTVAKPPRRPQGTAGPTTDQFARTPEPAAEPPPAEAKKEDAPMELAIGDEDMQPKGGVAESTGAAAPQAPERKSVSRTPLPAIEGEDRAGKDTTIAQLVKQCEAAAAKNDCAAVRSIAQKIAKQDPSTYRLKVSKNAAVARCLEPPAPAPVEAAPTNAQ